MSILSFVIVQALFLLILASIATSKSLESRAQRMAAVSKAALDTGEPLTDQLRSSDFVRASSASSTGGNPSVPAVGSYDPVRDIFRKVLEKSPGERLGRLDKQGRFVPERSMEKRSIFLNVSAIEELLDQEPTDEDSKESDCYIEIKIKRIIIKRISGRCSTLDGRPVCKTDSYYQASDQCSKAV